MFFGPIFFRRIILLFVSGKPNQSTHLNFMV